ncbi:MAG: hypothetical protein HY077_04435 [Elusimicrobia bacterium]|nr:hypothetical protein [Elusimicrobiota bacterium]
MKNNRLLCAALVASLYGVPAAAQEFFGQGAIEEALLGLKFSAGKPGVPRQPADATAAVPRFIIPPKDLYPVRGVDVSHYQGAIQWEKVKNGGMSFAFIKATEGSDLTDDKFLANWQGARRAGLKRGAYHFYNFCQKGALQADHFMKIVPAVSGALPVAVDLEASNSCRKMPSKAALRQGVGAFIAKIKKAYGKTPAIYVNEDYYGKYFKGENDPYPVWITDTGKPPELPDRGEWTFWQFSFKGQVPGIGGYVDLDVFNGDAPAFAKLGAAGR